MSLPTQCTHPARTCPSESHREARKYICRAYELKETCKPAADWCKDMAAKHLEFNAKGHDLAKNLIADYAASGKHSDLAPGMQAVYNDLHCDMMRETAEIQTMISGYK